MCETRRVACGLSLAFSAMAFGAPSHQPAQQPSAQPVNLPASWSEQKVTAADGEANTNFGTAVALRGSIAAIGAYGDDSYRGAVYLFQKENGVWSQADKLVAADGLGGDEFGYRITLSDTRIVVGAFTATIGSNTSQGSAYVFSPMDGQWTQSQKLVAADGGVFDNFGASVADAGETLFIGANGATEGDVHSQGAVYAFTLADGSWTQAQKIVADDAAENDNFGIAVASEGDTLLVSAPLADIDGRSDQGAVYVFRRSGTQWIQVQKLVADDGASFADFGMSMALAGNQVLIGAYGDNSLSGAAYVFSSNGGMWTQTRKIVAGDGQAGDMFGSGVAWSGMTALIAADGALVDGNTSRGAGYVFDVSGDAWTQEAKLVASDGTTDDFLGASLALDGDTAVLATPHPSIGGNDWQGAAYFFSQDRIFGDGFDAASGAAVAHP